VIGANGQLGTNLCAEHRRVGDDVIELNEGPIDVRDPEGLAHAVKEAAPDILINTAAFHHVEKCEADPALAFAVNALGARNAAVAAREVDAYLIHISTDYVFDGKKGSPYIETDLPAPLNVYGNTKLSGEHFVRATWERSLVLRTAGLYGKSPCLGKGRNFVDLMLKLASERDEIRVVDNEVLTPTSAIEVARQVVRLTRSPIYGLCHGTCEGQSSWHGFAREIFEIAGLKVNLQVARPDEFPMKVPRPMYSVLENAELKRRGLNTFRPWQDALREYLAS
jgi:dTDP-4-dehydrorhamnose reductase